ncbi:M23 family metallopeptidase [Saccharopolyspora rosea]|uniref:M23 family metallopeptidase n=1 Tax=Saccharopolyspora rosea TaxID=524884 RepID=A0ABW3FKF4_9PSEU|nr:M23 family metallopeptidase [Saccharopolyspora rosea]
MVVAAVAAGAFAAAGQSLAAGEGNAAAEPDDFNPRDAAATFNTAAAETSTSHLGTGGNAPAPEVLPVAKKSDADAELQKVAKGERIAQERAAAEAEANRPKYVVPAQGVFTSGFGGRWGTTHYGIDIANSKGTPIVAAADGTVIEAGPASGFGLWVRVQHDDGTITVYGHVNTITAEEGQQVKAGDQIATMGNRGFSTGPHLHFEVWNPSGKKVNPLPWMQEHNISPL